MKVFFLTPWWPNRFAPHHGNFVEKHARLVARRHELTVVTVQPDPELDRGERRVNRYEQDGYRVLQTYFGQPVGTPGWRKPILRRRAWWALLTESSGKYGTPDLLHGHVLVDGGIVAGMFARRWQRPWVITEHSTIYHRKALPWLRGVMARWACRNAAYVLPVSEQLGTVMQKDFGISGNYRPVSNVVDGALFRPGPTSAGVVRFLHVSNFADDHKNLSGLLAGFRIAADKLGAAISLTVAGDGDFAFVRTALDREGLGDVVAVSGPHSEAEIAGLMAGHDAFVLFSNHENQPVVLLEAQCCGLPIVSTDVGGIPEILGEGDPALGMLVAPGDTLALAAALEEVATGIDRYDPATIRARAARYREAAVAAALEEVYQAAT